MKKFGFTFAEVLTGLGTMPLVFSKAGYTLAEVLITLGIIGVVAAMTIPVLISSYKAQVLRSQFLKSYSVLQQAVKQMEADDVSLNSSDYEDYYNRFYLTFMKYLKGVTDCGTTGAGKELPCVNVTSKRYLGLSKKGNVTYAMLDDGQIALPDGSVLFFENEPGSSIVYITVDINGYSNSPNVFGHDLFTFQLLDGKLLPVGGIGTSVNEWGNIVAITSDNRNKYCNKTDSSGEDWFNGIGCAYEALSNADYFKNLSK